MSVPSLIFPYISPTFTVCSLRTALVQIISNYFHYFLLISTILFFTTYDNCTVHYDSPPQFNMGHNSTLKRLGLCIIFRNRESSPCHHGGILKRRSTNPGALTYRISYKSDFSVYKPRNLQFVLRVRRSYRIFLITFTTFCLYLLYFSSPPKALIL